MDFMIEAGARFLWIGGCAPYLYKPRLAEPLVVNEIRCNSDGETWIFSTNPETGVTLPSSLDVFLEQTEPAPSVTRRKKEDSS